MILGINKKVWIVIILACLLLALALGFLLNQNKVIAEIQLMPGFFTDVKHNLYVFKIKKNKKVELQYIKLKYPLPDSDHSDTGNIVFFPSDLFDTIQTKRKFVLSEEKWKRSMVLIENMDSHLDDVMYSEINIPRWYIAVKSSKSFYDSYYQVPNGSTKWVYQEKRPEDKSYRYNSLFSPTIVELVDMLIEEGNIEIDFAYETYVERDETYVGKKG